MQPQQTEDLGEWLSKEQARMGITYDDGTSKEQLRAAFAQLCQHGIQGEEDIVSYWGYREKTLDNGDRKRVELFALDAMITLPDGTRYSLRLIGPYESLKDGGYWRAG